MGFWKQIMKIIPIFIILLFFSGVLIMVYVTWTTLNRRGDTSSSSYGLFGGVPADEGFNVNPQIKGMGPGGDEIWAGGNTFSVDEVALYGEDVFREAERINRKVIPMLRRHVLDGSKMINHINHYGVNFSSLPARKKPNRRNIMCRIKSIKFKLLNSKSSSILENKPFPQEPLLSDIVQGNPRELDVPNQLDDQSEPMYRSCAVIPNSAALDGSNHGLDIDSHDFIIRFNNAPTKGYEEHVGTLTSLRILNSQVFTNSEFGFPSSTYFNDQNENTDPAQIDNDLLEKHNKLDLLWSESKKYLIWDPCNFTSTIEQWYKNPDHPLFDKYFQLLSNTKRYGKDRYYILNCRVIWEFWKILYESTFVKIHGNPPTSGFLGIALALQKCDRVNVYEYIPSIRESSRCHYYSPKNQSNPSCTYGSWHPVSAEKILALSLSDSNDKQVFIDGLLSIPGVSHYKC